MDIFKKQKVQLLDKILRSVTLLCIILLCSVSHPVLAGRIGGVKDADAEELQRSENEYADVIFMGKVNGNTEDKVFYITALNLKTNEQFGFKFYTYNHMITKGKLPLGNYEIIDGGINNDWTGEFAPKNIKFSIDNRSTAKKVAIEFGTGSGSSRSNDKIYQTKQDQKKVKTRSYKTDNSETYFTYIAISVLLAILMISIKIVWKVYKKFKD